MRCVGAQSSFTVLVMTSPLLNVTAILNKVFRIASYVVLVFTMS